MQGPIQNSRDNREENISIVDTNEIFLRRGTPVVCHGLNNVAHLNGKIGDIRKIDLDEAGRCEVHFEDTNLEPCVYNIRDRKSVV